MNSTKLLRTDYYTLAVYLFFGILIYLIYNFKLIHQATINTFLLSYGIMGSLLLYGFYTERFKVQKIMFIWTLIALLQITIYFFYKNNPDFNDKIGGSYLESLIYLPFMLIIFQTLSFFYKLIFGFDIIIVNLRINKIGDIVGKRKITLFDTIFSYLGLALIIFNIFIIKQIT